jgi:hypothetical protein
MIDLEIPGASALIDHALTSTGDQGGAQYGRDMPFEVSHRRDVNAAFHHRRQKRITEKASNPTGVHRANASNLTRLSW